MCGGVFKMNYPVQEHSHSINDVIGRMYTVHKPQEIRGNMVHRNQTWKSESRKISGYGTDGKMCVKICFDDGYKNGQQSFAITAEVRTNESAEQGDIAAGGCLHDDIKKIFPELAPLIKWHLMDTTGPMHYIANTCYLASDRDYNGRQAGEPSTFETVIYFADSPVSHSISKSFAAFLESRQNTGDFNIEEHNHPDNEKPGAYKFSPKYSFAGYASKWHECPFNARSTAEEWQKACNSGNFKIDIIVTAYAEGKERDLDAARSCAVWPEATDEQLSLEKDDLTALLTARLPSMIAEFKADMERVGFLWL
jgi:hypothetical protein